MPPGKEVYGGAKILGSALLQPARSVCVSSERFSLILLVDAKFWNATDSCKQFRTSEVGE